MWGYERIRGVVYSLDFWLAEDRPALCAAVTVRNPQTETVPMYWWTNIAMPLGTGSRVFTPATRAYTDIDEAVTLVDVPEVEGVDVSWPARVPRARDFFFVLTDAAPRFLAAVDGDGRGLLHSSSARLVSRKLFVWGDSPRGRWWQSFLTERAGPYYEVQAGLAPTQYACIPMPAGAEWSWVERFEPLALDGAAAVGEFAEVSDRIAREPRLADFAGDEAFAAGLRRVPATVVRRGNADAQLEDELRARQGLPPLAPELDFASDDPRTGRWSEFLRTGRLAPPPPGAPPPYDVAGPAWAALLREAAADPERADANVLYHLGLVELDLGDVDAARDALLRSLELGETPWARYALAAVDARAGRVADAVESARRALAARPGDLALAKSALRILRDAGAWAQLLAAAAELVPELQHEGRIRFLRAVALHGLGRDAEARSILEAGGGLELADLREGDDTLTELAEAVGATVG
jgi:tetratricopeptide (TPR) repeat protein